MSVTANGRTVADVKTQLALSAVAAASLLFASPARADDRRPAIHEGGDTQPCVVEAEFDLINQGGRASVVSRIFDTNGHRVGKRSMARVMAEEYPQLVGAGVVTTPAQFRQVREYATCLPGFVLVEFNKHTRQVASAYFEVSYDPNAIRMMAN